MISETNTTRALARHVSYSTTWPSQQLLDREADFELQAGRHSRAEILSRLADEMRSAVSA